METFILRFTHPDAGEHRAVVESENQAEAEVLGRAEAVERRGGDIERWSVWALPPEGEAPVAPEPLL